MNITHDKKTNELVLRVSLTQPQYNPYMTDDEPMGETDNLVGVCRGDEYHISYLIDMDYKGKEDQEGMALIMFASKEKLVKTCHELGIGVFIEDSVMWKDRKEV